MTTTPHATIRRNVTVGRGVAVHAAMLYVNAAGEPTRNGYTLCGSEGRTPGASALRVTAGEVTCKRCPAAAQVEAAGPVDEQGVTVDPAARAIIEARAAQLDALPTDDEVEALLDEVEARADADAAAVAEHEALVAEVTEPTEAERLAAQGVSTRTVGRDLYEVVVKGTAAGRVMMGGTSWHGYDLAGTRITGLGVDTLSEAVAAVVALGATPDHPHGATPIADRLAGQGTDADLVAKVAAAEVGIAQAPAHLRPALDAYGEAISAHEQTYGASPACSCGRPFRTRQGVGLHISAEHKRAGREYDAAARVANDTHRLAMRLRAGRPAGTTARERLAARHGMTVEQVAAVTDEVLDGTPATDALDEQPRPLDAGEVTPRTGTSWVVFCPAHQHYLVRASAGGTTWADDQADARRWPSKGPARDAADLATWLDHNPVPWAVADDTVAVLDRG